MCLCSGSDCICQLHSQRSFDAKTHFVNKKSHTKLRLMKFVRSNHRLLAMFSIFYITPGVSFIHSFAFQCISISMIFESINCNWPAHSNGRNCVRVCAYLDLIFRQHRDWMWRKAKTMRWHVNENATQHRKKRWLRLRTQTLADGCWKIENNANAIWGARVRKRSPTWFTAHSHSHFRIDSATQLTTTTIRTTIVIIKCIEVAFTKQVADCIWVKCYCVSVWLTRAVHVCKFI